MFPALRNKFLKCWITQPESLAIGAIEENRLFGYGVIRKCLVGYKIGPLFADSRAIAEKRFLELNNFVEPDTLIYLDIPEVNKDAIALVKDHQMKEVFQTARMYTREIPQLDVNRIFGVTTFEMG